jgi:predicted metal-dependent peptidase
MQFSKIIGNIDEKLVAQAEEKLSAVFLELGTNYKNKDVGSGIGGDPLIFSLLYPMEHVCTLSMPTAATDGKRYFWNPEFVLKKNRIGLRIVAAHEAGHAIYMHPQRRGSRNPKLWNIAVDYLVNGMCMEDFQTRDLNAADMFRKNLGNYITLEEYANVLRNPWESKFPGSDVEPPKFPIEDWDGVREFTEKEQPLVDQYKKEYEDYRDKTSCFFADPDLKEEMKSPEAIYEYLYSLLPKCPECGSVGKYQQKPESDKGDDNDSSSGSSGNEGKSKKKSKKSKDKDSKDQDAGQSPCNDPNHQHGNGNQKCDHDHGGCGTCGDGMDIFGFGNTLDDHMETEESEEKLAKRISDAMEAAKKMAGHVPAALEAELGKLTEPKIAWTDVIRGKILRSRSGNDRNDWTRFRSRPLFAGLLTPKRKTYSANFGCLVDCSGSMSADDVSFGLSQLKAIDSQSEGTLTPSDAEIFWDKSVKIRRCNDEELTKFKRVGLGGTRFAPYFTEYEKHIGKCDFLIVITDGYLDPVDIAEMRHPDCPVYWIVTSPYSFTAPFGKVFSLR